MTKLNNKQEKRYQIEKCVYIFLMFIAFTTRIVDFTLPKELPWIISFCILSYTLIQIYKKRKSYNNESSFKAVLRLYLVPAILIHLYTIIMTLLGKMDASFISTNISAYSPILVAASSIYLFGSDALRYNIIAILASWVIRIGSATIIKGVGIFPFAIRQAYFDDLTPILGVSDNYLELHDIVLTLGLILTYYFYSKTAPTKKDLPIIILFIVIFLLGMKRIALLGLACSILFIIVSKKIKDKHISVYYTITGISVFLASILFIVIIFNSHFQTSIGNVNLMGRNYYFDTIKKYGTLSPTFLGIGRNSVSKLLVQQYAYLHVGGVHSDLLKMYIEDGFIVFTLWLWYYLLQLPRLIKRNLNTNAATLYLALTVYTFILYTTDNVENYYIYQTIFTSLPMCYYLRATKSDGTPVYTKPDSKKQASKILFIDHCVDVVGGVERIINAIANYFSSDHNVQILSEEKLVARPFFEYNQEIKKEYLFNRTSGILHNSQNNNSLAGHIKEIAIIALMKSVRSHKIRRFFKKNHNIDVIIFGRTTVALHFLPIIKEMNITAKIIVRDAIYLDNIPIRKQREIHQLFPGTVHTFIVSSNESMSTYKKFFKPAKINIVKIYNPLAITPKQSWSFGNKNIVAIGRLDDVQKGFDALLSAFKIIQQKHPDWRLTIYGGGQEKEKLQRLIQQQRLKNVRIHNFTSNVVKVFNQASVFAFPSRYEGYANTLVEALACGVPSVTFNWLMGAEEIIDNNKNGIIVPLQDRTAYANGAINQNDTRNFANAICKLIENEKLAQKFAENAPKIIDSRSKTKILNEWEKLIESS